MLVYVLPGTLETREADLDALWEAGATGLEERAGTLRAYFDAQADLALGGEWTDEPDQDWQADWKKGLTPVTAGRFTIAPSWLAGEVPPSQIALLIDPGMAFGTGHHATTRLAVEALGQLDLAGRRVLDVGSGSGVLALAAALGGAGAGAGARHRPGDAARRHRERPAQRPERDSRHAGPLCDARRQPETSRWGASTPTRPTNPNTTCWSPTCSPSCTICWPERTERCCTRIRLNPDRHSARPLAAGARSLDPRGLYPGGRDARRRVGTHHRPLKLMARF